MDEQKSNDTQSAEPQTFKPGDTIAPATSSSAAPSVHASENKSSPTVTQGLQAEPAQPAALPDPVIPTATPSSNAKSTPPPNSNTLPNDVPEPEAVNKNKFYDEDTAAQPQVDASPDTSISWTASEFIAHDKSPAWYGALALGALLLAALVYLFTRDRISTAVVIVAGAALGIYGARKPQQLRYILDDQGISIGQKFFLYDEFRSFSIIDEGAFSSISFLPLKRFGQLVTIYFDPKDREPIIDLLANRLPLENRQHDVVDRFMKHIRF